MLPVLPYTRPKTKDGFFRKHEYIYDEHYNCYLCPQGQILKYTTTTKEGYRQYKSNPLICAKCPSLSQCTESKHHQKLIQRHIWESYVEEAEHLRHSYDIKQIYAKRKETIERVFADAKEKHGMRWTTLRGLKIVHAGDAYFCCHEFKETGYLDVASSLREQLCSKSMLDLVV